jgi:hypothetical protein
MLLGPNPNRLATSADGRYLYAGIDDASAFQSFDFLTATAGARIPLGSAQTALALKVCPTNSSAVAIYRTTDAKIAGYENGVKLVNELSGLSLFAFSGVNGALYACDGSHTAVPLYSVAWTTSGLALSSSQPAQQSGTDLKSDGGLLFYNRGMVVDPIAQLVSALMPVPNNSLVEPDVSSGRVFYLSPAGGGWVLHAFDLAQGIEVGASTINGLSGNPKRLVRSGADVFGICTDAGQVMIFHSPLVPTASAADLALSQTVSASSIKTNDNLSLVLFLTNNGPGTAQSIVVTQSYSLPVTGVTLTPSVGSASFSTNLVTWQPGSLLSGGAASLNIGLKPAQSGTLMVTAAARHSENDPNWANNAAIAVVNVLGGSTSNVLQLKLATRELVYDSFRNVIYATFPATNQFLGNVIGLLSPETGNLVGTLPAGSEPDQLALSSDGRFLYVSLDGAMAVRRFDLAGLGLDLQFPLSLSKAYNVFDLKVQPGQPRTIAVSRVNTAASVYPESVAVYDDAVARTNTAGVTKPLVFSADGTRIYGTITPGMGLGFLRLQVNTSGVTQLGSTFAYNGNTDFDIANGIVYGTTGIVLDPTVPTALGTNKASGPVTVDAGINRVFYLTQVGSNFELRAFPIGTYQSIGTNAVLGVLGTPGSLIRCGANRLAFRTTSNQIFIVHTSLVPTPGPPTITGFQPQGTTAQLVFSSVAGWSYVVEYSPALPGSGWAAVTGMIQTNVSQAVVSVPAGSTGSGFYRVRLIQ